MLVPGLAEMVTVCWVGWVIVTEPSVRVQFLFTASRIVNVYVPGPRPVKVAEDCQTGEAPMTA